jgi:hypothetical protein
MHRRDDECKVLGKDRLEDTSIHGSIILKWIIKKKCGRSRTGFVWFKRERDQ